MSLSVHVSPPVWADDATAKGVLKVCESVDEDLRLCLDRSSDSDSQLELNQSLSELIESITVPEDECGEDTVAEPPRAPRGSVGREIVADIVERILSRVEENAASAPRQPSAELTGAREIDCSRSRDVGKSRHRRADSPKKTERRKRDRSNHERKKLRRRSTSCSTTSSACSSLSRKHRRKHKHHRRKDEGEGETEAKVEVKAPCPRVNPIFLWVKQDDTRIVEVLCEDYDKRNRIRLTKTAHGWRATPRTERLDSTLSKSSLDLTPTVEDLPPLVTSEPPETKEKRQRGSGTRRRRRKRCDRKKVKGIKVENTYVNNNEHVDVVNNNHSSISNNNTIKVEKTLVTEPNISEPRLRSFGYKKSCHTGPKLDSKSKKKDNKRIADIDIYDFVSTPKTDSDMASEDPDSGSESDRQENDLKIKPEPEEELENDCEESQNMPEVSNFEVKQEPLLSEYSISKDKIEEKSMLEVPLKYERPCSENEKENKPVDNIEQSFGGTESEIVPELEIPKLADSHENTEKKDESQESKEEDKEYIKEAKVEILKIPQPSIVLMKTNPLMQPDSGPELCEEEKACTPLNINSTKDKENPEVSEKPSRSPKAVPDIKLETSNDKCENELPIENIEFEEKSIEETEEDQEEDEEDDTLPDIILPEPHLQTPEPSPQPVPEPSSTEPENSLTNLSLQPETSLDSDTIHLPDTTTKSDTASLINNDLSLGEKLSIKTDSEISITPSLLTPGSITNETKPLHPNTSINDLKTAKMIEQAEIDRQISADLDEDHLLAIEEILQGKECAEEFDDDDLPEEYHGTHESPVNLVIDLKSKDQVDNIGIPLSLRTDDFLEIFPSPLSLKEHSDMLPTLSTNTKSVTDKVEKLIPHAHQQSKTKFLESILSCNKKVHKEDCKKVDASDQQEPLYLGVSRKSASPTVSSSDGRKFSSPDLEPKPKRMKVDDITLKTILNRNKDTVTKTKVHKSKENDETLQTADSTTKSRLLELLTNENEEHISKLDPLTQLKEILSDPELTVPDPLLVPRSRLPALVANPAKEIPRLIALKSESLSYPKLLTDPDLLVVSLSHLQSLLQATGKEEEMLKYQQQAQLLQQQMKQDQTASGLDAATANALNQMMWLPYLSQLEAATMTCGGNSQDFMTMLNMLFPSGSYPQMNPYMMNPTSPGINAYDYKSQLEFQQAFALWNEAMMQAATNQFAAQSLSGRAATPNNNISKLYQNYQDTKFNPKSNSNAASKHLESKHAAARTSPITPNYQQSKYRSSQYPYTSMFSIPTSTPTTTTSISSANTSLYRTTQSYASTTQAQNSYHNSRARDFNYSTYASLRTPTHTSSSNHKSDHSTVSAMSTSDLYKNHQRNSTTSNNSNCKSLMNILSKPLPKQTEVKTSSYPTSKVYPTSTTMLPKETTIRLTHPTPSSTRQDPPPKLKVKQPQHLVDPNSKPKLFNFDEHGEVGSTTGSLTPQVDETHPNLWHPLFSRVEQPMPEQDSFQTSLDVAPSTSQAVINLHNSTTTSTEVFQPSVTSTPISKRKHRINAKRQVPVHLLKWRLAKKTNQADKTAGTTEPETTFTLVEASVVTHNHNNDISEPTSSSSSSTGMASDVQEKYSSSTDTADPVVSLESNFLMNESTRQYQEFTIEPDGRPPKDDFKIIDGRFIVDGRHFVEELRSLEYHRYECDKSNNGYMTLVASSSKSLSWTMTFKCPYCQKCKVINSQERNEEEPRRSQESNPGTNMSLLDEAVWGFAAIGSGHRHMEEVFTTMNISCPSEKTFKKTEERLGKIWQDVLFESMKEAGIQEKKLAIENGDVNSNNIPYITVVVDGGWSHRSHGHRYSANSGVVCVIGHRTKKLLHIDVRNKYCSKCVYQEKNGVSTNHKNCFKNWSGASASMESDMVVSAFNSSEEIHGLQYRRVIADGDSSVHHKIREMVSYGRFVEKIECSNHMIKNYTKRLFKIREDGNAEKRILNLSTIKRLKAAVRGAIIHYSKEKNIEELKKDLKNGPSHVLGFHKNCKSYFCKEVGTDKMLEGGTLHVLNKMQDALKPLLLRASTLWQNQTSNLAENYMSLVAKFTGGKQVNRGKSGSFTYRTRAAALDYQFGPMWHYSAMKTALKRSPALLVKKTCLSRIKRAINCRKSLLKGGKPKKFVKPVQENGNTGKQDYGNICQKLDIEEADMAEEKNNLLKSLALSSEEKTVIEIETRGQRENTRWLEERKLRVTASNFGLVCKRLPKSKWAPVVKHILYSKVVTSAMLYGEMNESAALHFFEDSFKTKVSPCGLFVDKAHDFLAGSPDGLVGDDEIIEVKCPKSAENITIKEAIKQIKSFCLEIEKCTGEVRLKRSHNYYYQIQGQLHVADKTVCHFVVWTKKDKHVEVIKRDDSFWKTRMEKKLCYFYNFALLPEIIDPRICRSMPIREPSISLAEFEKIN